MPYRLKELRRMLRLSQKEFGEGMGFSRDVISNVENGRVAPKDLFIRQICKCYGVNEEWLKTGEGEVFTTYPESNRMLEEATSIFQGLSPELQDCALKQIRVLAELNINPF